MDKNPPDRSLDTAAQQRLDEYLDAVEQALVESGTSRTERRAVCDEIEAQAREMAFARAADQPTAQDMAAVLAELDDPEAYRASGEPADGSSTAGSTTGDSKIHPFALSAFIIPFVVVALIFVPFPRG
ncbi:MAG: hypothetical protein JW719_09625, partial [Pirellulales bacterium]|nr:hypothetical protein [Pirellulales bacterium]